MINKERFEPVILSSLLRHTTYAELVLPTLIANTSNIKNGQSLTFINTYYQQHHKPPGQAELLIAAGEWRGMQADQTEVKDIILETVTDSRHVDQSWLIS